MIKLILATCILLMVGCTTAAKVQPMADEITILNALHDNGCDVAEFNQNTRRGQLQVKCNGPFINP